MNVTNSLSVVTYILPYKTNAISERRFFPKNVKRMEDVGAFSSAQKIPFGITGSAFASVQE